MSPGERVLNSLFPEALPNRLAQLVQPDLSLQDLIDFKMNPVLNSAPESATRLAIAAPGERDEWIKRVATVFRSTAISAFWFASPPHARLFIDTDGSRSYVIYNDDLQPPPSPLLALTLSLPKGGPSMVVRSPALPPLTGAIAEHVEAFRRQGVSGQWAVRRNQQDITGVLWVSESRWKGNAEETTQQVMSLPMAKGWTRRWNQLKAADFNLYPDAVEFRVDGTVDLTVGFL